MSAVRNRHVNALLKATRTRDHGRALAKSKVLANDNETGMVILGGMVRLNQAKGGHKVPPLGDLPLVGGPFRSIARGGTQSKLYVFVRAEIIRSEEAVAVRRCRFD